MAQLQHWSVACTTCDNPAQYHCNTCGDILCSKCKDIHQRSKGTGHHSIVLYSERVDPGKLIALCDNHPGHECLLWCQGCDKAACTECVTSADHVGHRFVKIAWRVEKQRESLREELDEHMKQLKFWEESLLQHQRSGKTFEDGIEELGKDITASADRVCVQVRNIEATLHQQLQGMKTSQTNIHQKQEESLKNGVEKVKQRIKEAEDKLRSQDIGSLLNYKAEEPKLEVNKPLKSDPPLLPVFTPGDLDMTSLETMIGELYTMKKGKCSEKETAESLMAESKRKAAMTEDTSSLQDLDQDESYSSISDKMSLLPLTTALPIPNVQIEKSSPPYLACTRTGHAWIRTSKGNLQLIDRQGALLQNLTVDFAIGGMATFTQGKLLISVYNDNSIKSISEEGNVQSLFITKGRPSGICCLHNGDIVVTFYEEGRVVEYDRTGKIVRELNKSLFRNPRNVAQNKVNKQIYVCDKSGDFLDTPGRVLSLNMASGKREYQYTGSDECTFTPWDVCTDHSGHVIITDWSNDLVHILDQKGKLLQYMLTKAQGLNRPYCVDTDTDGYAWISEWELMSRSQAKIVKYMG